MYTLQVSRRLGRCEGRNKVMKTIGFVGLGVMGVPMASHLVDAGYSLRVWNRTGAKAEAFVAEKGGKGAACAASPAEAARGADAVITIVADDAALRQVTYGESGLLGALPAGAVHMSMSTVSGQVTAELAEAHRARGSELLSAPVFGSKESAEAHKLWAIAAGRRESFDRCRPLLEAMAQGVIYLGEDPAIGARMKLLGNLMISSAIAGMVQAFTLAGRVGVPKEKVLEVIRFVFNSPVYERYGSRLVERNFAVHFPLQLMLKDLTLMLEMGAAAGVPLPHVNVVRDMVVAGLGQGRGERDAAGSLLETWETLAGVTPGQSA